LVVFRMNSGVGTDSGVLNVRVIASEGHDADRWYRNGPLTSSGCGSDVASAESDGSGVVVVVLGESSPWGRSGASVIGEEDGDDANPARLFVGNT
jgi:hypothetical protein